MNINNKPTTAIWFDKDQNKIRYIDQSLLPWELKFKDLESFEDAVRAIRNMEVRGAPLIGVTAAFGMWLAASERINLDKAASALLETRPTAVNLKWALEKMLEDGGSLRKAIEIRNSEIENCFQIGEHGLLLIEKIAQFKQGEPVNILTHCNAGWLACVEWGTATAPIYMSHNMRIPVHVWVDETRPRNQGAKLTAYELGQHGVDHTVIPDNTGGHLMQKGLVDIVIVGTDRVAANGDVANKIGTYLKALAAHDNGIPFYVAMPYSSFDPDTPSGNYIPIEERDEEEVRILEGCKIVPDESKVANYGFDLTPAKLVTAYITEKGILQKDELSSQAL